MKKRIEWIDTVRAVTMFLVIVGHATYMKISTDYGGVDYTMFGGHESISYKLLSMIVGIIYLFHMPLFMAVSGACFKFGFKKIENFTTLIQSKFKRLIIPFLITSFLVAIPIKYISGFWCNSTNIFEDILLGQFVFFNCVHLWFIVSLFEIFIVYYFIEKLNIKKGLLFWGILIFLSWLGYFLGEKYNPFAISSAIRNLIYFALGYNFISLIDEKISKWGLKQVLLLSITFVLIFFFYSLFGHFFKKDLIYKAFFYPYQTIMAVMGILLIVAVSMKIGKSTLVLNCRVYKLFSQRSYELYLFSDPFNYLLLFLMFPKWGNTIYTDNEHSILMFIITILGTTLAAVLLTWIYGKINKKELFT